MSDRRLILAAAAAALAFGSASLPAQTLAELRAESARLQKEVAEKRARIDRTSGWELAGVDRMVSAGGRIVRFRSSEVSSRDSAALAEGLELGLQQLKTRFGDAAAALADTREFGMVRERERGVRRQGYVIVPVATPYFGRTFVSAPIQAENVARLVLMQAGDRLVARVPALHQFAGFAAFARVTETDEELARTLATSWASAGRRCAAGALTSCAAITEVPAKGSRLGTWFEPRDYRELVVSARLPALSDSATIVSRRRCLDGADSACARVAPLLEPADPFGVFLRGSMLSYAIERGGPGSVSRLLAASDSAPGAPALALLVRASGISESELLGGWQRRLMSSVSNGVGELMAPLSAAVLWALLMLFGSIRRRYL